jgi:hypothetical protein
MAHGYSAVGGAMLSAQQKDIRYVVLDLLDKLENEGINGVRAWFARKPDVVVIPDFDGWEVVISRGRITIKITLDREYNVTSIRVMYG